MSEPLLSKENSRLTILPIQYPDIWNMYKKHEAAIWHAHEVKLDKDLEYWEKMSNDERHFIKFILAFFASSDLIVAENLATRFLREIQVVEAKVFYGFQLAMENIHCVAPETMILTDRGYYQISTLMDCSTNVWNGQEFSRVTIRQTSKVPVKLTRVTLDNGMHLDCTSEHKWLITDIVSATNSLINFSNSINPNTNINTNVITDTSTIVANDEFIYDESRVMTKDLSVGMCIRISDMPIVYLGSNGSNIVHRLGDVPLTRTLDYKISWLSDYLSKKMNNRYEIVDELPVLKNLQLLFQTLSINVSISTVGINTNTRLTNIRTEQDLSVINLHRHHIYVLKQLGADIAYELVGLTNDEMCAIRNLSHTNKPKKYCTIVSIKKDIREDLTYCFNELIRHSGVFNGILTGQSEVYSNLISTYITDPVEKKYLFDAVETIPCVKRKAEWAKKWIEYNSYETRETLETGVLNEQHEVNETSAASGFNEVDELNILVESGELGNVSETDRTKLLSLMSKLNELEKSLDTQDTQNKQRKKEEQKVQVQVKEEPEEEHISNINIRHTDVQDTSKLTNSNFATRLVAFAVVEGIFFSGAFCAIFWLSEKGKMPGLTQSNEFIARDEGMHTDFAVLLYTRYVLNKLSQKRIEDIFKEAVDIEIDFITNAIPCRLIGMNATLMIEYVKYCANRLVKQLGHDEIYKNVSQPFKFMDRIGLMNKSNFFEQEPTEYQKGSDKTAGNNSDFFEAL